MSYILSVVGQIAPGIGASLVLFVLTLIFSMPLGLVICFGRMSKFRPLSMVVNFIISVLRGTPLMLQLVVVFFGPYYVFGLAVSNTWRFWAAVVGFSINYAAYFAEIYRSGIQSIPVGQYEAGQVLGLTKTQTFFKVVLFQVVKRIMAPMSNEVITLVKDTSLANVIAVGELIMSAQNIVKVYAIIWPLFYTAIFYLIFCGVLTLLFNALEKKLNYYRG